MIGKYIWVIKSIKGDFVTYRSDDGWECMQFDDKIRFYRRGHTEEIDYFPTALLFFQTKVVG